MAKGNKARRDVPVLLAVRPGRPRDSLLILLRVGLGIDGVSLADDSASALRMVSERHPGLVLLDTNLPGEEVTALLKRIKADANGSQSRCLVLADNFRQRREARSAGADAALVKGFPTAELFEVIEELLPERKMG
jgi:DNA-binding response OmpR family regulator